MKRFSVLYSKDKRYKAVRIKLGYEVHELQANGRYKERKAVFGKRSMQNFLFTPVTFGYFENLHERINHRVYVKENFEKYCLMVWNCNAYCMPFTTVYSASMNTTSFYKKVYDYRNKKAIYK
jgi:hypothetical protein